MNEGLAMANRNNNSQISKCVCGWVLPKHTDIHIIYINHEDVETTLLSLSCPECHQSFEIKDFDTININ